MLSSIPLSSFFAHPGDTSIRLAEVDIERCQIRITQGKGHKDRHVPFPYSFRELLAVHMERMGEKGAVYLFESSRRNKYTDRGVRKMLARYASQAGITRSMFPHKWRHFLFTWLKKEGIDDALIQPYSGHATRQSLEIYSRLSLIRCSAFLQSGDGALSYSVGGYSSYRIWPLSLNGTKNHAQEPLPNLLRFVVLEVDRVCRSLDGSCRLPDQESLPREVCQQPDHLGTHPDIGLGAWDNYLNAPHT